MVVRTMDTCRTPMPSPSHPRDGLLDYEQQRIARMEENKQRLLALGLADLSQSLARSAPRAVKRTKPRAYQASPKLLSTPAQTRRSSRLLGTPLPSYKEVSRFKDLSRVEQIREAHGSKPEYYSEEHEERLGSCTNEWELFKDGYGPDGNRIYDSERGKTCHQCRQKTLGLRTSCSQCESLRGQFCGDCLFMRYGENVLEVNQNKNWTCPVCRGICNCSFCRIKKGWAPTGTLYRTVTSLGFKSVAHYLIMTRRAPTEISNTALKIDTEEAVEKIIPKETARKALIFDPSLSVDVSDDDNGAKLEKVEISVYEVSDTEHDDVLKAADPETIAGRLRKRPRMNHRT